MERNFSSAAQPRQGRAKVVSYVVERLAHGTDQRLIFIQQTVEHDDQLVEVVIRLPDRDAGIKLTRMNDGTSGIDNLPDGLKRALSHKSARQKAEQNCRAAGEEKAAAYRVEQGLAAIGAAANAQDRSI